MEWLRGCRGRGATVNHTQEDARSRDTGSGKPRLSDRPRGVSYHYAVRRAWRWLRITAASILHQSPWWAMQQISITSTLLFRCSSPVFLY